MRLTSKSFRPSNRPNLGTTIFQARGHMPCVEKTPSSASRFLPVMNRRGSPKVSQPEIPTHIWGHKKFVGWLEWQAYFISLKDSDGKVMHLNFPLAYHSDPAWSAQTDSTEHTVSKPAYFVGDFNWDHWDHDQVMIKWLIGSPDFHIFRSMNSYQKPGALGIPHHLQSPKNMSMSRRSVVNMSTVF